MSPKDTRALREEAAEAVAAGKWKRALACYLELERAEPDDAQWSKRAAELYRRLGKLKDAIAAYDRAAERYARGGFALQAIAVGKVILQLDPDHDQTRQRHAVISEGRPARPTPPVPTAPAPPSWTATADSVRDGPGFDFEMDPVPPPAVPRTLTPIRLPATASIDQVALGEIWPGARIRQRDDGSSAGIVIIPFDDEPSGVITTNPPALTLEERLVRDDPASDTPEPLEPDLDVAMEELSEDDLIEMAELPAPLAVSAVARRTLLSTPLLAGLAPAALEALLERSQLVHRTTGETLFREGEPGDTLYVLVEGEVSVIAEGPPRIEVASLGPGSFFGEIALVTDQPRSATITARMPIEALAIGRAAVNELLGEHPEILPLVLRFVRDRLIDRLVHTSPMFAPMSEAQRQDLAAKFAFVEIEPGAVMVAEGSRGDGVYVLLAGAADVARGDRIVARLGPGDLAGMTPFVDAEPAQATVRARSKCLALQLEAAVLREVIMTHPHVLEYIGDQLARRRREVTGDDRDSYDLHVDLL